MISISIVAFLALVALKYPIRIIEPRGRVLLDGSIRKRKEFHEFQKLLSQKRRLWGHYLNQFIHRKGIRMRFVCQGNLDCEKCCRDRKRRILSYASIQHISEKRIRFNL